MSEIACPSCGHVHNVIARPHIPTRARMSFQLKSEPGHRLKARTIGGCLVEMDKMNRLAGREHDCQTVTLVDGIEMSDGEITFHLIVTNVSRPTPTDGAPR